MVFTVITRPPYGSDEIETPATAIVMPGATMSPAGPTKFGVWPEGLADVDVWVPLTPACWLVVPLTGGDVTDPTTFVAWTLKKYCVLGSRPATRMLPDAPPLTALPKAT